MNTLESALAGIEQMTSKATEGPWKIGARGNKVTTGPSDRKTVADCPFTHSNAKNSFLPSAEECQLNADFIAASRTLVPALLKALRHEMETSEELRTDSLPWVMRYDCTRAEYLEKRREELAAILADGREGR